MTMNATDTPNATATAVASSDGLGRASSMAEDLYECANRKCRHIYKHKDAVLVRKPMRPGPKTLPAWTGTCPKCGCSTFFMAKNRKRPNTELSGAKRPLQ